MKNAGFCIASGTVSAPRTRSCLLHQTQRHYLAVPFLRPLPTYYPLDEHQLYRIKGHTTAFEFASRWAPPRSIYRPGLTRQLSQV